MFSILVKVICTGQGTINPQKETPPPTTASLFMPYPPITIYSPSHSPSLDLTDLKKNSDAD
ncbi:hypothetical protein BS50DRAFT_243208 [Corynespora cassiicola Philippines]|uniref:Uncharacterized protein n=1 Tax=Corynespora cassiicola Philippines TaxID=1448308 RepID=A0A2T2P386_CORCC|nr:hypothetical protein BS50DRAFT_243208 [Corynespora cassiicola Philippines]